MRVGKRLVFVNPTLIPTVCFKERRLERCWFSQIQLLIQPLPLMYKGWKTVGFRQSTVIPTMCFKVRRLERGWFSQNQPSLQPWTLRYEIWNGVGFRKTNRHSNHRLRYTKVGTGLVFAKPTAIPTKGFNIPRLERSWFSQNQTSFQPWTSKFECWNGVGFRKSTVILTFGLNTRRLERGWFSQIQLSIQPLPLMYEGWKTVGFRQSNRHSNLVL